MKVTSKSRLQYKIQHSMFIVLLAGCLGFAGWLSTEYDFRSDWTAGKRHSLSNDTLKLLEQLTSPVKLRSYQPDEATLNQAITEILQRYQNAKNDFSFELINPDIFIEQARSDNIERYGQTIIEYNGQTERIHSLSEENISNALLRLYRQNKPRIVFLSQHGERNITDPSAVGYSQLASQLNNKGFDVSNINLLQQTLTTDGVVLVLGSINKPLLENEQQKILQFIKDGGNLLWLQDPKIDTSQQSIADELKLHFIDGVVVDSNQEVSRMLQLSHPAIIPVLEYKMHPITEKMQYYTLFTTASAISKLADNDNRINPWIDSDLLITSDSSWSETKNFILGVEFNADEDTAGPLSIGIAQQRQIKLNSATLDKPVPEDSGADSSDPGKPVSEKSIPEEADQGNVKTAQRVAVIGDTDFLANNNIGHGANLDFIIKTLNWLAEDDKLITIAPKNAPDLQLNLSATAASIIGLTFLIALPLSLLLTGSYIWRKRRKQ